MVSHNKVELKHSRKIIKEIIESDMISQGVGSVIQEMQAAMLAARVASTAIYGSQAANAVVLVTTKRGPIGRLSVEYEGFGGFQSHCTAGYGK